MDKELDFKEELKFEEVEEIELFDSVTRNRDLAICLGASVAVAVCVILT